MLRAYCTTWSQQKPTPSGGKIFVGSSCVNEPPPSVEYAATEFAVENTTSRPLLAPPGSAIVLTVPAPAELRPIGWLASNTTAGCASGSGARGGAPGARVMPVRSGVGGPDTSGPV